MDPLHVLVLGALMGLLGQGSRAVAGLKSMADDAQSLGVNPNDLFQAARLLVSLVIGVLVGLAAALIYLASGATQNPDWHYLLSFAAAGYAGTDFLEAFISKYLAPVTRPNVIASAPPASGGTAPGGASQSAAPPPMPAPISTPKQLVYSVINQLRPGEQITDNTPLASLAWDDYESKDILRWQIDDRRWRGVNLGVGALANCTKVSDVTQVVTSALPKVAPPNAQPKPTPASPKKASASATS